YSMSRRRRWSSRRNSRSPIIKSLAPLDVAAHEPVVGFYQKGYGNAGRSRVTGTTRVVRKVGDLNAIPPKKVDTYDLEVDYAPTTNAIFMAKLSPADSINGDDVGPS
ncbi:hypothetical protein Tco_1435693, partial [Tanacetum coccineum]